MGVYCFRSDFLSLVETWWTERSNLYGWWKINFTHKRPCSKVNEATLACIVFHKHSFSFLFINSQRISLSPLSFSHRHTHTYTHGALSLHETVKKNHISDKMFTQDGENDTCCKNGGEEICYSNDQGLLDKVIPDRIIGGQSNEAAKG